MLYIMSKFGANPSKELLVNFISILCPFALYAGINKLYGVLLQFAFTAAVICFSKEEFEATCLFLKRTKAT